MFGISLCNIQISKRALNDNPKRTIVCSLCKIIDREMSNLALGKSVIKIHTYQSNLYI